MENKVVTKKVLAKAGFNVPQSIEFTDVKVRSKISPLLKIELSWLSQNQRILV